MIDLCLPIPEDKVLSDLKNVFIYKDLCTVILEFKNFFHSNHYDRILEAWAKMVDYIANGYPLKYNVNSVLLDLSDIYEDYKDEDVNESFIMQKVILLRFDSKHMFETYIADIQKTSPLPNIIFK